MVEEEYGLDSFQEGVQRDHSYTQQSNTPNNIFSHTGISIHNETRQGGAKGRWTTVITSGSRTRVIGVTTDSVSTHARRPSNTNGSIQHTNRSIHSFHAAIYPITRPSIHSRNETIHSRGNLSIYAAIYPFTRPSIQPRNGTIQSRNGTI